jgi:hypothetical protein
MLAGGELEAAASCPNTVRKHASVISSFIALKPSLLKAVEIVSCHKAFAKADVSSGRSKVLTSYVGIDARIMRCLHTTSRRPLGWIAAAMVL